MAFSLVLSFLIVQWLSQPWLLHMLGWPHRCRCRYCRWRVVQTFLLWLPERFRLLLNLSGNVDWQADNGAIVAKRKAKLHPGLTIKSPHGRKNRSLQESGQWSRRQAVEKLPWHSQQRHNTHSLLAILPTDGGLRCEHQTSDLIDASGAALMTSIEKGSALLQRFIQQSN